jgi:hypothetical protein
VSLLDYGFVVFDHFEEGVRAVVRVCRLDWKRRNRVEGLDVVMDIE